MDFEKKRVHEIVEGQKGGTSRYSALWQADRTKIMRMAPADYMGRYMDEWWDYAIADEIHQLASDTAQGNALGVLTRASRRFLGLTGTLLSGYADDLFNTLFRTDAKHMVEDGYQWGPAGRERFTHDFGVIETCSWRRSFSLRPIPMRTFYEPVLWIAQHFSRESRLAPRPARSTHKL